MYLLSQTLIINKSSFSNSKFILVSNFVKMLVCKRDYKICRSHFSDNGYNGLCLLCYFSVLLALCKLYAVSGNPLAAMPHLLDCLTLACSHYLDHTAALASMCIGHLQVSKCTLSDTTHFHHNVTETLSYNLSRLGFWLLSIKYES